MRTVSHAADFLVNSVKILPNVHCVMKWKAIESFCDTEKKKFRANCTNPTYL